MTQSAMYQSIARATGESVSRIRQMGFSLVPMIACGLDGHVTGARPTDRALQLHTRLRSY